MDPLPPRPPEPPAVSVAPCWAVDEGRRVRHDVDGAYHLAYENGMHYLLSVREPAR